MVDILLKHRMVGSDHDNMILRNQWFDLCLTPIKVLHIKDSTTPLWDPTVGSTPISITYISN